MTGMLAGKVALITGAARGIGRGIAERFARQGAAVALVDVDADAVKAAAAAVAGATGGRALGLAADVLDATTLEHAAERCARELGPIDCVVVNAGVLQLQPVLDMDRSDWQRVIDVNLTGAFVTAQVLGRRLVEQDKGGRIIFTSSLFGRRGGVGNGAYSASKFGVIGLMESLAAELAPHGILVNAVCPGQVRTEMMDRVVQDRAALTGCSSADVERDLVARVPLRRMGLVDEVADVFVFLASDLSRYVTGQSLIVDGGWQVG